MAAWLIIIFGSAVALAGLVVAGRALFADRARGRRRCPRCWYDLAGTPSLTCPECGRTARRERDLARTRRRWGRAALGLVVCILGTGSALAPAMSRQAWMASSPRPLLVAAIWLTDASEDRLVVELDRRIQGLPQTSQASMLGFPNALPSGPGLTTSDFTGPELSLLRGALLAAWTTRTDLSMPYGRYSRWATPAAESIHGWFPWLGPDAAPMVDPLLRIYESDRTAAALRVRTLDLLPTLNQRIPDVAAACVRTAVRPVDLARRLEALQTVSKLQGVGAIVGDPRLLALLQDPDRDVRSGVVQAIGPHAYENVVAGDALALAARADPDGPIRHLALASLLSTPQRCGARLRTFAEAREQDQHPTVRASALLALRLCGCDGAELRRHATASLADPHPDVQLQALWTLREQGAAACDALPKVRALEGSPHEEVARLAADTARVIEGEPAPEVAPPRSSPAG